LVMSCALGTAKGGKIEFQKNITNEPTKLLKINDGGFGTNHIIENRDIYLI
jgi:hypothetical protein